MIICVCTKAGCPFFRLVWSSDIVPSCWSDDILLPFLVFGITSMWIRSIKKRIQLKRMWVGRRGGGVAELRETGNVQSTWMKALSRNLEINPRKFMFENWVTTSNWPLLCWDKRGNFKYQARGFRAHCSGFIIKLTQCDSNKTMSNFFHKQATAAGGQSYSEQTQSSTRTRVYKCYSCLCFHLLRFIESCSHKASNN